MHHPSQRATLDAGNGSSCRPWFSPEYVLHSVQTKCIKEAEVIFPESKN